jgi:hypothetical protein
MHAWSSGSGGFGVSLPLEELAEGKMLDYWEFAQHFGVIHLQHAFVDLSPAVFDARDVEQDRRVLPERSLFDVEDELNSTVIHVTRLVLCDSRL